MLNVQEVKRWLGEIAIHHAVKKEDTPVLLLGDTGSGKSTLANYLLGWNMYWTEDGEVMPVEASAPMQMGSGAESVTLFPQLQTGVDGVRYCDCPGFSDNRSDELRVCASIATELVIKTARHIAGVVVVIDYSSLIATKGAKFRKLLVMLDAHFNAIDQNAASIIYVFNKVPENVEKHYILKKLRDLNTFRDNRVLNQMLQNDEKIWVANIFDKGSSRVEIMRCVRSLQPLEADAFNFQHGDPLRDELRSLLDQIVLEGLENQRLCQQLPENIAHLQSVYDEHENEIQQQSEEIQRLHQQQANILQAGILVKEANKSIEKNQALLVAKQTQLTVLEEKKEDLLKKLQNIDSDESTSCWKKAYGPVRAAATSDNQAIVDFVDTVIGAEGLFSAGVGLLNRAPSPMVAGFNYQGPRIVDIDKVARGGNFERESVNVVAGTLVMQFVGRPDEEQYASVEIFTEKRLVPANIKLMDALREEIASVAKQLECVKTDIQFLSQLLLQFQTKFETLSEQSKQQYVVDLVDLTKSHIQELRQRQIGLHTERLQKENRLHEAKESVQHNRAIYEIVAELLSLLSGVEQKNDNIDQFLENFSPISNIVLDVITASTESGKDEVGELRREIEMMKCQIKMLQKQVNQLTQLVQHGQQPSFSSVNMKKKSGLFS